MGENSAERGLSIGSTHFDFIVSLPRCNSKKSFGDYILVDLSTAEQFVCLIFSLIFNTIFI